MESYGYTLTPSLWQPVPHMVQKKVLAASGALRTIPPQVSRTLLSVSSGIPSRCRTEQSPLILAFLQICVLILVLAAYLDRRD